MGDVRGSRWRKWDFHVHTPYSVLKNGFGINPRNDTSGQHFDNYARNLFERAINKGIAAIGVTDYFCIDGYKRLKNEYLCSDEALRRVLPLDVDIDAARNILLMPNIEFRTKDFVGDKAHALNNHVLFSNEVSPDAIESYFLQELHIITGTGEKRPLSHQSLVDLGRESAKGRNDCTNDYYRLGLNLVTVERSEVRSVLEGCSAFKDKYLIVVPVDEDLSEVSWYGRSYPTRREIYSECDCYLTSNAATRRWALAKGEERERIEEFGSIKPCIWGSDAHDFDSLFEPAEQRYCWLKADVTFEGLRQILLEPESRVRIQREKPGSTDRHKVIDRLQVRSLSFGKDKGTVFQEEPVVFNEGLTCIIGGKSTGKSLLLSALAHSIDDKYANAQESGTRIPFTRGLLDAETVWADGTSDRRRFIYIPQAYLNRLVDNPQRRTETDEIIESVLLQDENRKLAHDEMLRKLQKLKGEAFVAIEEYCDLKDRRDNLLRLVGRDGSSDMFLASIARLEEERDAIAKQSQLSEDEVVRYETLCVAIESLEKENEDLGGDLQILNDMPTPVVVIPGHVIMRGRELSNNFTGMSPTSAKKVEVILGDERSAVGVRWRDARKSILVDIASKRKSNSLAISRHKEERLPLKTKIEQSEQLRKIAARLDEERKKGIEAKEREDLIRQHEDNMASIKSKLLGIRGEVLAVIESYCGIVNRSVEKRTSLEFSACPVWKREDFVSKLLSQVDNRGLSQFSYVFGTDLRELKEEDYDDALFVHIWDALENPEEPGGLRTKAGYTFQNVLQQLTDNWYNVHYAVMSDGDEMDSMSPGKKSLVLLELIIDLDREMCPLLIDQPEDDLDNRSVYNDLVSYIRRCKARRQIIIVTHNANVVLGTDSEEVIIANQEGADTPNASRRFEYRSGAIENDDAVPGGSKGTLYKRGLQTQMCDILEGGPEALERRRRKYTSTSLEWTT